MPERYVANVDLTVEQAGKKPLKYAAGDECRNAPAGWPPKWVVNQGLVSPIAEPDKNTNKPSPAASGASEENA